jgi:hypothetical protein
MINPKKLQHKNPLLKIKIQNTDKTLKKAEITPTPKKKEKDIIETEKPFTPSKKFKNIQQQKNQRRSN